MNYIEQINLFRDWLKGNYLSPYAKLLWHYLMHACNSSGWQEWIQVSNKSLEEELDAKDRHTVYKYRDELVEAGLIQYRKGKRGTFPFYKVNELSRDKKGRILFGGQLGNTLGVPDYLNSLPNQLPNTLPSSVPSSIPNPVPNELPNQLPNNTPNTENIYITKQNKTKRDKTKPEKTSAKADKASAAVKLNYQKILEFWNSNCREMPTIKSIGKPRQDKLRSLVKNHKQTEESILAVLKKACDSDFMAAEKKNWPSFDWCLEIKNFTKISEGNYDNERNKQEFKQQNPEQFSAHSYFMQMAQEGERYEQSGYQQDYGSPFGSIPEQL